MGEWIEWNGGECPVDPGARVDVKIRDRAIYRRVPVDQINWRGTGGQSDIIAYRMVKQP